MRLQIIGLFMLLSLVLIELKQIHLHIMEMAEKYCPRPGTAADGSNRTLHVRLPINIHDVPADLKQD